MRISAAAAVILAVMFTGGCGGTDTRTPTQVYLDTYQGEPLVRTASNDLLLKAGHGFCNTLKQTNDWNTAERVTRETWSIPDDNTMRGVELAATANRSLCPVG